MPSEDQPAVQEPLLEIIKSLIEICVLRENLSGVAQVGLPLRESPDQRLKPLVHSEVRAAIMTFAWLEYQVVLNRARVAEVIEILKGIAHLNGGQDATLADAIDEHPLLEALNFFLHVKKEGGTYEISAATLLQELDEVGRDKRLDMKHSLWPKTASYLSRRLGELNEQTWLRQIGYEFVNGQAPENRKPSGRMVTLRRLDDCTGDVPSM